MGVTGIPSNVDLGEFLTAAVGTANAVNKGATAEQLADFLSEHSITAAEATAMGTFLTEVALNDPEGAFIPGQAPLIRGVTHTITSKLNEAVKILETREAAVKEMGPFFEEIGLPESVYGKWDAHSVDQSLLAIVQHEAVQSHPNQFVQKALMAGDQARVSVDYGNLNAAKAVVTALRQADVGLDEGVLEPWLVAASDDLDQMDRTDLSNAGKVEISLLQTTFMEMFRSNTSVSFNRPPMPMPVDFSFGATLGSAEPAMEVGDTKNAAEGKTVTFKVGDELARVFNAKVGNANVDQLIAGVKGDEKDGVSDEQAQQKALNELSAFVGIPMGFDGLGVREAVTVQATVKIPDPETGEMKEKTEAITLVPLQSYNELPVMPPAPGDQIGLAVFCEGGGFGLVTAEGGGGGSPIVVFKPVVYLYPEQPQEVSVQVQLKGRYVAQYPTPNESNDTWRMRATPTGMMLDPKTEKKYPYLFWEGLKDVPFELDNSQAFCVEGKNATTFLEKVADSYAFNDQERTDFISYWIAHLSQNDVNVVQFLDEKTYDDYAHMTVSPSPDTTIRLFMVFRRGHGMEKCGNPELPQLERKGFTVVEWGGTNLDLRA